MKIHPFDKTYKKEINLNSFNKDDQKILLLGYGYSAKYTEKYLRDKFPEIEIFKTSRSQADCIYFDLEEENSWKNLPQLSSCILFFPIKEVAKIENLLNSQAWTNITIVGTTGSFLVEELNQEINEDSKLDTEHERYEVEESIRKYGGKVIFSSGIYGPGKSPVNWLRNSRVKNSPSYVNLIHVEDLAQCIVHAHLFGEKSKNYIATNNQPEKWSDLISRWREHFEFPEPEMTSDIKSKSKKVYAKYLNSLGVSIRHNDLDKSILQIENKP